MTVIPVRNYVRARLVTLIGFTIVIHVGLSAADAQTTSRLSGTLATFVSEGASGTLRVVMQGPQSEVDRLAAAYGLRIVKRLELGAVVEGTSQQYEALAGDPNAPVLTTDDVVVSTMAVSTQSTGASQLWAKEGAGSFGGLTGSGVVVGVIDSGVHLHPDVAKRLKASFDFTGDESGQADGYGHGTHIASIIAGSGGGSRTADGSAYVGMAPAAEIISLRVLGADGNGYVSDVIAAIEFAIRRKDRYKLRVLNISLGHAATARYQDDPMAKAVERAVAAGIVVVASAGNYGKTEDGTPIVGAVVSPGFTPGALTVGALNTRGHGGAWR